MVGDGGVGAALLKQGECLGWLVEEKSDAQPG